MAKKKRRKIKVSYLQYWLSFSICIFCHFVGGCKKDKDICETMEAGNYGWVRLEPDTKLTDFKE